MEETYLDTAPFPFSAHLETPTSNTILGPSPYALGWLEVPRIAIQSLNYLRRQLITSRRKLIRLLSLCLLFLAHLNSYVNFIRFIFCTYFKVYRWVVRRHITSILQHILFPLLLPNPFQNNFSPLRFLLWTLKREAHIDYLKVKWRRKCCISEDNDSCCSWEKYTRTPFLHLSILWLFFIDFRKLLIDCKKI